MNITAPDAKLTYFPDFISMSESLSLFNDFNANVPWQQDEIIIYGRKVLIPRLQAWYGDPQAAYQYSGLSLSPLPWFSELLAMKQAVEKVTNTRFNAALVNLYRDGNDTVGWHSDNEPELGTQPTIASVSLGQSRRFNLKHKNLKEKLSIELASGSLLVMAGQTQHYWQHCLPRSKRVLMPRINITFRKIIYNKEA